MCALCVNAMSVTEKCTTDLPTVLDTSVNITVSNLTAVQDLPVPTYDKLVMNCDTTPTTDHVLHEITAASSHHHGT